MKKQLIKEVAYGLMWIILIIILVTLNRGSRKAEEGIVITDEMIVFPTPPDTDTLHYTVRGAFDDNLIILVDQWGYECILEVESAYVPQYYPGVTITLIK